MAFNPGTVTTTSLPASMNAARALISYIDSGPGAGTGYLEILPAADPFPTSQIWWVSAAKTAKIVETLLTYTPGTPFVATVTWNLYANDGVTLVASAVDTYAYSGPFVTSITRVVT